jgi:hypothetical protein
VVLLTSDGTDSIHSCGSWEAGEDGIAGPVAVNSPHPATVRDLSRSPHRNVIIIVSDAATAWLSGWQQHPLWDAVISARVNE